MDETVAELLKLSTMTLATTNPSGEAHAAPVYFAARLDSGLPLDLFFFSDPDSRHAQDLSANPMAAAAIYPETTSWQDIRGLQLHGLVHSISPGAKWDAAWQVYLTKFPFTGTMKAIIARNVFFTFQTSWMRLVNNRLGFGNKQEWTLDVPK